MGGRCTVWLSEGPVKNKQVSYHRQSAHCAGASSRGHHCSHPVAGGAPRMNILLKAYMIYCKV